MATKYIEINSTYRNRVLWPSPSRFDVVAGPHGQYDARSAVDPVSTAAPLKTWLSNNMNEILQPSVTIAATANITGTGVLAASSYTTFTITGAAGTQLHQEDDYYKHLILADTVSGIPIRSRIVSYDYIGNNQATVTVDPPLDPRNANYNFVIRDPTEIAVDKLFVPAGSDLKDAYKNYLIYNETQNEFLTIQSYDNVTGLLYAPDMSALGWSASDRYSIRKSIPVVTGTAGAASTTSTVVVSSAAGTVPGNFIRIREQFPNTAPGNEMRRIVSYDANTATATVSPPFTATTANRAYEILAFSSDNFYPLPYTLQPNEQTYFQLTLKSITLPNRTLTTGEGGSVLELPHVYVELSPLDFPPVNLLFSNNPNSRNVIFRASYNNFDYNGTNKFVHFIGDGVTHKIWYQLETNFRFRVTLSNGQQFSVDGNETVSPSEPNPDLQITAMFELRKL